MSTVPNQPVQIQLSVVPSYALTVLQGTHEVEGFIRRASVCERRTTSLKRVPPTLGSQDAGHEHRTRGAWLSRRSQGLRLLSSFDRQRTCVSAKHTNVSKCRHSEGLCPGTGLRIDQSLH